MKDVQKIANTYGLTIKYDALANCIRSKVKIVKPNSTEVICEDAVGIWDTGASASAISSALAKKLNLVPVSFNVVDTANGPRPANVYYLSVILPNDVIVNNLRVTDGNMPCDMLLGMDIMMLGDLHISNCNRKTVFTFRMPSIEEKDYEKDMKMARACAAKATPPKKRK